MTEGPTITPIDFHYWPTPNGWKVAIMLEECGLPYVVKLVDLGAGDQFTPEFLAISPNNRMPAIVDHDVAGAPVSVFESGAILMYLAEKTGRFMPRDALGRKEAWEWLFWQVGNQGPMGGQHSHFWNYAPEAEKDGYAAKRYRREYERCFGVLERRLEGREFILGEYSIADMICWPWMLIAKAMGCSLETYPNVTRWRRDVKERPAVQRGVNLAKPDAPKGEMSATARQTLFGGGPGKTR